MVKGRSKTFDYSDNCGISTCAVPVDVIQIACYFEKRLERTIKDLYYRDMTKCKEISCEKTKIAAKGLCMTHYKKQHNPTGKKYPPRGMSTWERIEWTGWDEAPSELGTPCWETRYNRDWFGYGLVTDNNRQTRSAHRESYLHHYGPIEQDGSYHGPTVMHLCDNPPCVNPGHLQLGTQSENIQGAWDRDRFPEGASKHRLSKDDVARIKELLAEKTLKQHEIAKLFDVTAPMISSIHNGRTHKEA